MSEQVVKRYSLSEFAEQHTHPVGPGTYVEATEYDALHAEAEALLAENGRLRADQGVVAHAHLLRAQVAERELEAARGLLREVELLAEAREHGYAERQHGDVINYRCANAVVEMLPLIQDFLTTTPAPEVPDHLRDSAKMVTPEESIDDRLKQAGMLSVAELLNGAPLDAFIKHAGVHDLASLLQWAEMRRGECLRMMALYDLGEKDKGDDLYEWTVAHCAVFTELHVNLRAALAEQGERQEASGYACHHCGEDAGKPDPYKAYVECPHCGKRTAATCAAARGFAKQYTTPQPGPDVRGLTAFALELIDGALEGGSFDGGDIQEAGVRHGLLIVEQREESCGEHCSCAEHGFPIECYRLTPAIAAHRQTQQGGSHDA